MQDFFYPDGFKDLVPDSFDCPYQCNTCSFQVEKHHTHYNIISDGCTELGCSCKDHPADEKLCFDNWLLSPKLRYKSFSIFVNNCINGYRNFFYIREIQGTIDKNFSIQSSQTEEHTRVSLSKGIDFSNQLYELLLKKGDFSKENLMRSSRYFANPKSFLDPRYFFNYTQYSRPPFDYKNKLRDIFGYLRFNFFLEEIDHSITYAMIQHFDKQIQELELKTYMNPDIDTSIYT